MNPTFPPLITCPPPQARMGGIYIADKGKTHQESRVLAAQVVVENDPGARAFLIRPCGPKNIVYTGSHLRDELEKGKRLEVIA